MKVLRSLLGATLLCGCLLALWIDGYAQLEKGAYSILALTLNQNQILEIGLDGTIKRTAPTGKDPHEVVISPQGRVFVTNTTEPSVSVIDAATFRDMGHLRSPYFGASTETTALPHGIDLNRDATTLYVTTERAEKPGVVAYDLRTSATQSYIETGAKGGHLVRVHPKRNRAYVVNSRSNSVSVIDTEKNALKGTIQLQAGPMSMDFAEDGTLWVATNDGGVSIIDTEKDAVRQQLTGKGKGNGRIRLSPDRRIALVTHADGADVFDAKSKQWLTYFPIENDQSVTGVKHAIYACFSPSGDIAYLSAINASSILIFDMKTYKEVRRWKLPTRVTTVDIFYPNRKSASEQRTR